MDGHRRNAQSESPTGRVQPGGIGFNITGVPLAEDSALIDAGLDFTLGTNMSAALSYSGQFGDGVQDNAVKGRFTWLF